MMKIVNAGNVTLGEGMPKIAVPVLAANAAEAREQGERIMRSPADLVELRADYIVDCRNADMVRDVLSALKETVPDRPLLFTLRTDAEGGRAELTDAEYETVCCGAMDTGLPDLIDIEHSRGCGPEREADTARRLCAYAAERGVITVFSRHDFQGTPPAEEITERMLRMADDGADLVKMAVMPHTEEDAAELLRASAVLKRRQAENGVPFILISMAEKGMISRMSGEVFGSAVTFAQAGLASAPGQIDADDLDRVLRIIHRHTGREEPADSGMSRMSSGNGSISLIGFMGTGKTTIARRLSRMTGMKAVEIDDLLVEEAGMSIPDIFRKYGEAYFRDLEEQVCRKTAAGKPSIISCGGGTPMRQANVDSLKEAGPVILLEGNPDTIYERVRRTKGDRPMLARYMSRGYVSWLMKQRAAAYCRAADAVIFIDGKTPEEIAEEILRVSGRGDGQE